MKYDYDTIIVGGGPAGATAALYAEQMGLNVLLVEKKSFPRDKICGDAISGKSVLYLQELGLIDSLESLPHVKVYSVLFSSPNGNAVNIRFKSGESNSANSGYICRRELYDNLLFQTACKKVETIEKFIVKDLIWSNGQVTGVQGRSEDGSEREITAKVVIGADGFSSIVSRKTGLYEHDPDHHLVATRAYYTGVTGLSDAIEIHYIKEMVPGYFWIFPSDNGMANVGLGMVYRALKKKGVRLRFAHMEAAASPHFKERFKNAKLVGDIQGWNLPVGSKRRQVHGNGFILIGDAAGLIDPFTGEGIGNAMFSGKIAAEVLSEVCRRTDFSAVALSEYHRRLRKQLSGEFNLSYRLQKMARYMPLVNLVVNRAERFPEVSDWISGMMSGTISKRELLSPLTYIKLFFK